MWQVHYVRSNKVTFMNAVELQEAFPKVIYFFLQLGTCNQIVIRNTQYGTVIAERIK